MVALSITKKLPGEHLNVTYTFERLNTVVQ